ncbi:MAG: DUF1003 domain-containing protein [Chitinophagaceae bacterium]
MDDKFIDQLFEQENVQIQKLHDIVKQTVDDEKLIIENLLHPPNEILTRGQDFSDKVARFVGSWAFILTFMIILVCWILFNTLTPNRDQFDKYPFILMNLILSCVAALQAPIIMISQNRQEEKDRKRSQNDYLINLKSELEIRSLHQKMDLLLEEQLKSLHDIQLKQLELLKEINEKIKVTNEQS